MPVAVVYSRALSAMQAPLVTVEVHLANGLPAFNLVGLPETEVKESRERVRAALQNSQLDFPGSRRITVNLAPADLPKESGRFDLPIAIGILAATGQIPGHRLHEYEFAGELALSGELRPVRGALAMTLKACGDGRAFILPCASAPEAALVRDAVVLPAKSLLDVCAHLMDRGALAQQPAALLISPVDGNAYPDLADVKGQPQAKRALEIAASGQHSLLMIGPPGTGKSMLAQRLPGILPPIMESEALEAAGVQSLTGKFRLATWGHRPYRSPHHTASAVALVGGGGDPRPGEISLAHHGVLFLDELPEFDRRVLEVLREPLESGRIHISRAARQVEFPAQFQLVAAMNPCPCGYFGHPSGRCHCTPERIFRYRNRISGPLLDRIDIQIEVSGLEPDAMVGSIAAESSAEVRTRVVAARERQVARQGMPNALLSPKDVERFCRPDSAGEALLRQAIARLNLSARAYHRVLKVARTIADVAGSEGITAAAVAEAIGYRRGVDRSC